MLLATIRTASPSSALSQATDPGVDPRASDSFETLSLLIDGVGCEDGANAKAKGSKAEFEIDTRLARAAALEALQRPCLLLHLRVRERTQSKLGNMAVLQLALGKQWEEGQRGWKPARAAPGCESARAAAHSLLLTVTQLNLSQPLLRCHPARPLVSSDLI